MDWAEYKALCDRPDVCSRWLLERTLAVLDDDPVAATLQRVLARDPLPRPADHAGPAATDMFVTGLDAVVVGAVLARVLRADAAGGLAAALGGRSTVGFVAAWREFALYAGVAPADR